MQEKQLQKNEVTENAASETAAKAETTKAAENTVKAESAKAAAPKPAVKPAAKPAAKKPAIQYKTNLLVTSAPHLVTTLDTRKTMFYVLLGLLPCIIAATIFFGPGALARVLFGGIFGFLFEWAYEKIMKKPDTTSDLSCLVTGVILALNVPANFPIWMMVIGIGVAIVIVKELYGGIGRNIANPALVGRVVLLLSWTSQMTTWPTTRFQQTVTDAVTGATPLGLLADGAMDQAPGLGQMFLGNIGGAMGETCTLAILIGGLFLIWKKIISPVIPCAFIGTVFVIALIYYAVTGGAGDYNAFQMALYHILAGGVFFGAFFCATDYVTSPIMKRGRLIYGIGCGIVTMVIRLMCSYPEGVSFAILFMNIMTPLIDRYTERQFYGIAKREKMAKQAAKAEAKAAAAAAPEGTK